MADCDSEPEVAEDPVKPKFEALTEAYNYLVSVKDDGLSQDDVKAYVGAVSTAAYELEEAWIARLDAEASEG